jgi:hypothetical protein
MSMGEKVNIHEGARILLLCARCKEPVEQGKEHICKENKNGEEKEKTRSNG